MGTVRFILGRAGTGKTRALLDRMADLCRGEPLGPPVYWLVPKQATFQAERQLTDRLGGFARVRVVDFGRLGEAVLHSCGDVPGADVTAAGRRMILGHLLRANRDRLKFYGRSATRPGLADELDATFAELERAGVTADALAAVPDTLDPATDPAADVLRHKLHDLGVLWQAYGAHLEHKLDPHRRRAAVIDRVADCSALRSAVLLVDDVFTFSGYERQLLAAVAAAADHTDVALPLDPDDPAVADPALPLDELSVFHRTARAYRGLRAAFRGLTVGTLPLRTVHRDGPLRALERDLFTAGSGQGDPTGSVALFEAADARAEVDAVARHIRAAVADGVTRYRDVAVLVRSLGDYRELVHASFAEHGIPYFADHRRTAGHHPLLRVVRSALLVARGDWPTEAVMALAKSGLTGLTPAAADALENHAILHRLRGRAAWESPGDWPGVRHVTRGADEPPLADVPVDGIDAARRQLLRGLAPLLAIRAAGRTPVRDVARAVFDVLGQFEVGQTLGRWVAAEPNPERRAEHGQVWAELTGLFDQMVAVTGDERVDLSEFLDVLDAGLEGFDLAVAPPTVDQVLLGEVDRTRTPADVRLAFVLGLAEGQFPRADADAIVLTDAERHALRQRSVDLDGDTRRQLLDERFLFYLACTRPTRRLTVSRPLADAKGRGLNPSPFWQAVRRACPDVAVDRVGRASADDPDTVGTPRQLTEALMRWVRAGADPADGTLAALYQWFAGQAGPGSSVATVRAHAWPALRYANVATVTTAQATVLFPNPLRATVRQLEDAAACPFRHFAKYGLQLAERPGGEVTPVDLHNAYHQVIEQLTRDLLDRRTDWTHLDPAQARQLIRTHAEAVARELRGELMLSTARNQYLLGHIERTLERNVTSLREFSRAGRFRPAYANLPFGMGSRGLPPLAVRTPAGHTVELRGRIDRVDLNERNTAFTVSDYRLAPAPVSLEKAYYGLSLQLLVYLLVVRDHAATLPGGKPLVPAAAFLLGLVRPPEAVDHPDVDVSQKRRPRGLIDERAVDALDEKLAGTGGASGVVVAYRNKDGTAGRANATDTATAAEFAALLAWAGRKIGEAADRVVAGDVSVRPYLLGRQSPCSRCEYRAVCRFEPGSDPYRVLPPVTRADVLLRVVEGKD